MKYSEDSKQNTCNNGSDETWIVVVQCSTGTGWNKSIFIWGDSLDTCGDHYIDGFGWESNMVVCDALNCDIFCG